MSHFAVLVIGPDVDAQLQSFHEFECTGTNDEYVQDVEITEEVQTRINAGESLVEALSWYGLEEKIVATESDIDREDKHKYGYAIVHDKRPDVSPEHIAVSIIGMDLDQVQITRAKSAVLNAVAAPRLVKVVNRTNPNKHWDWWVLGGRWQGMLMLKPSAWGVKGKPGTGGSKHPNHGVDQARKGDVDFEAMRTMAANRAGERWDAVHAIVAGRTWQTWPEVRDAHEDLDQARIAYREQPVVVDLQKQGDFVWDTDDFAMARDVYVERARNGAVQTFAVVKDGKWYERGSMGWWGCVSDAMSDEEWSRQFTELVDGLSDDTLISVVDCHI